VALLGGSAFCQEDSFAALPSLPDPQEAVPSFRTISFDVANLPVGTFEQDASGNTGDGQHHGVAAAPADTEQHGLVYRAVRRTLDDQKGLYEAPFKPRNFKWDLPVLAGTALFLITDRHIEHNLPGGHYQLYQDTSNISIGGLSATLAGVWLYGIKTEHRHARETGFLELETLTDTFLIYTPMQLIAGRQRPGEGNGHGDFLKHHAINTSFPGGHAMFTWAMATVVAHEYSQKWVQALAYTAAFAVTASRFLARDHWASDMWLGSALGIGIGTWVYHEHCDPSLSASCEHDTHFIF
jgi:hypothetical protein